MQKSLRPFKTWSNRGLETFLGAMERAFKREPNLIHTQAPEHLKGCKEELSLRLLLDCPKDPKYRREPLSDESNATKSTAS